MGVGAIGIVLSFLSGFFFRRCQSALFKPFEPDPSATPAVVAYLQLELMGVAVKLPDLSSQLFIFLDGLSAFFKKVSPQVEQYLQFFPSLLLFCNASSIYGFMPRLYILF